MKQLCIVFTCMALFSFYVDTAPQDDLTLQVAGYNFFTVLDGTIVPVDEQGHELDLLSKASEAHLPVRAVVFNEEVMGAQSDIWSEERVKPPSTSNIVKGTLPPLMVDNPSSHLSVINTDATVFDGGVLSTNHPPLIVAEDQNGKPRSSILLVKQEIPVFVAEGALRLHPPPLEDELSISLTEEQLPLLVEPETEKISALATEQRPRHQVLAVETDVPFSTTMRGYRLDSSPLENETPIAGKAEHLWPFSQAFKGNSFFPPPQNLLQHYISMPEEEVPIPPMEKLSRPYTTQSKPTAPLLKIGKHSRNNNKAAKKKRSAFGG